MKILPGTMLRALSLCAALSSIASAQQGPQQVGPLHVEFTPATAPPLPVAEAKKRYREKQKQLEELAKGEWIKDGVYTLHEDVRVNQEGQLQKIPITRFDAVQDPRDRIRAAVSEAFDARRALQQAELAELENRIARIKRALEIRDAMRDTIIDQRTDELLDQIEEGNKSDTRDGASRGYPGATDRAVAPPSGSGSVKFSPLEIKQARLDVKEAETKLARAKRALDQAKDLNSKAGLPQESVDERAIQYERAKLELEQAQEKLKAREGAADGAVVPAAEADARTSEADRRLGELDAELAAEETAGDVATAQKALEYAKKMHSKGYVAAEDVDAKTSELRRATLKLERAKRLAELDLHDAKTAFTAANKAYSRVLKLHATGAIAQDAFDEAEEKFQHAKIQLERARVKFDSRLTAEKSADRPAESTTTSPDRGQVDQARIVWGQPVGFLQLGWDVEPRKAAYTPGEVVTVGLVIRNIGDQAIEVDSPPSNSLERMGLDFALLSVDGENLSWEWGPAHQDRDSLKSVERFRGRFAPGGVYGFPRFKLSLGEPADASLFRDLMGGLDVKAGQVARLTFKLSSVVAAGDNPIELQSEPFEFRVDEPGAKK